MAPNGYIWWYVDALSDDGQHGLTIIAFIGSVFSPYYANARRRAAALGGASAGADADAGANPLDHCSLNVSLYSTDKKHWTMTERRQTAIHRDATTLQIGSSALRWADNTLTIDIDEVTVPWPSRVRGQIIVHVPSITQATFNLDEAGRHRWKPLAPSARIDVQLNRPERAWQGAAYLDSNAGDEPLEDAFVGWQWCRAALPDGHTIVMYDGQRHDGSLFTLGKSFDRDGNMTPFDLPPRANLPATSWQLPRSTFSEADFVPVIAKPLEDGPFYARSLVALRLNQQSAMAFHETLSLDRFRSRWVQAMLPFRMPRR